MTDLVVCIQAKFRTDLSESLNQINHRLPQFDDDRLSNLLCNLHNTYTGNEYVASTNKVSKEMMTIIIPKIILYIF